MRIIAHLDMDAFFAAVEERDNPRFFGLPIVIGSDPQNGHGRGVVSTANYKAREYGIRSATPITRAWQFSEAARRQGKPAAIFLPVDFEKYAAVSQKIMIILRKYSAMVEQTSIDEAFFDLSQTGSFEKAKNICQKIKQEIKKKERLTCSIGIGPNKLIAKIASDFQKPDSLTVVEQKYVEAFLEPLPVRKIPGIGPKTEAKFKKIGISFVGDLKKLSEADLNRMIGKWGLEIYEKVRGIDDSPIIQEYETKSIGEQETFLKDTLEANFIFERLDAMAKNILRRLRKDSFKNFKTIFIIVRFFDFETKTKSHTLQKPTDSLNVLKFEAFKLLAPFLDKRQNPRKKLIRLIGLRVEKLA